MFCTKCGANIQDGSKFCVQCGAQIGDITVNVTPKKEIKKKCSVPKAIILVLLLSALVVGLYFFLHSDFYYYLKDNKNGNEYYAEGAYEKALESHQSAYEYKKSEKLEEAICADYSAIGDAFIVEGKFEKAVQNHKAMMEYGAEEAEVNALIIEDYSKWSDSYYEKGDYQEAINTRKNLLKYGVQKTEVDNYITDCYIAWANVYLKKDDPQKALETVYKGIDEKSDERLWAKAQEVKDHTVIINAKYEEYGPTHVVYSYERKYTYDEKGNLLKQNHVNLIGNLINGWEYIEYTYDEKNNLIEEREYKEGDSLYIKTIHTYDENNNRIKSVFYRGGDFKTGTIKYKYDENNNLIKETQYDMDNKKTRTGKYTYDENKCLIKKSFAHKNSNWVQEWIYTYDKESKKLIKVVEQFPSSSAPFEGSKKAYSYDAYGDLKKIIEQSENCEKYNETYNAFGDIIEIHGSGDIQKHVITYTYHYIGNLTEENNES